MELWSALVLGLVGSLHCAGMCGPLALALPGPQKTSGGYVAGRTAYNLGRVATYSMLGIVFGLAGKSMLVAGLQSSVSIVLGVVLLVGLLASRRIALSRPIAFWVAGLKARMSGLFRRRTLGSMALLGSLNGLLPCGLVYVACVGAAATGNLFKGAQYMAVFGSGTFPMMLALSLSGKLISPRVRFKLAGAIPVAGFALAALLILRGLSLGIPYLSPDLAGGASCCHAVPH
jgi:sulfite exporter TauE/SafE